MSKPLKIRTAADALALVEFTIGRRPSESLAVLATSATAVGPALRLDLPEQLDPHTLRAYSLYVVNAITAGGPVDRMMIALYSENVERYGGITDAVTEAANAEGIDLARLFHCTPAAWRPVVPELEVWAMWSEVTHSTVSLTARVEHGMIERPEVAAPDYVGGEQQGAAIDRTAATLSVTNGDGPNHRDVMAARLVIGTLTKARTVETGAAATVAAMVQNRVLRDWILVDAYGIDEGAEQASQWERLMTGTAVPNWRRVDRVERVISTVLAMTPPSHRANLYVVLAFFAWTKGLGSDAAAWANLAREAEAEHALAGLIIQACGHGFIHPLAQNRDTAYRR